MLKWPFVIMSCHVQWGLAVLWILFILPTNGYIINQDGHLVPYKVYKKGSYQMCVIHPRNCRGGSRYRKRSNVEALAPSSDKLYELDIFKRKISRQTNPNLLEMYDAATDALYPSDIVSVGTSRDNDLRDFRDRNEPSNQITYDFISRRNEDTEHSNNKADVYQNINDESKQLYKQLLTNQQNAASSNHYQGLADPPAPDRKQISALLEEFPIYDTLEAIITKYNEHSGAKSDIFDPNDTLSLYEVQKRR